MAALQLLVALVVLLTSDGALLYGNQQCDDMKCYLFCVSVMEAYEENNKAVRELRSYPFLDDKERLQNTNYAILKVLKLKRANKSELLEAVRGPLNQEVHELFQLRAICNNGRRTVAECVEPLRAVFQATYNLAYATLDVAEGSQREAIEEAEKKFREEFRGTGKKPFFELGYDFGREVLDILEQQS